MADALRDIVVIGCSAGGLPALKDMLNGVPADLPAALFLVQHAAEASQLARILHHIGPLPAVEATPGLEVQRGRLCVARPDAHLLLHDGHVLVRRGARENMARPAIDPLFRSAAVSFGPQVIGIVLSGELDDGTAGLLAVKRCGGVAIVQDPADALHGAMPASARRHVAVDHCLPAAQLGALLARLVVEPAGPSLPVPADIRFAAAIAAQELADPPDMDTEDRLGVPSRLSCPECSGALWEIADGPLLRYRCHVGHAFTAEAMQVSQAKNVESTLWRLVRMHRERAELTRRMAAQEQAAGRQRLADLLLRRAKGYDEDAELIHGLLERGDNAAT